MMGQTALFDQQKTKEKPDKIWIWLFFTSLIFCISLNDVDYFCLLILPCAYGMMYKIYQQKHFWFYCCLLLLPIGAFCLLNNFNIFKYLPNDFFINHLSNYTQQIYPENVAGWIMMTIFNQRESEFAQLIYQQSQELSVAYLLSVGGFQVVLINYLINWLFKKQSKLNQIIKYLTIAFYTYLLGFSAGILRVFIAKNIRWFFPRKNREEVLGIGGIVTLIILPNASTQFGFLLSYLCTYGIIVVSQWKINSKLINILLINLICEIIAIPFVIKMQNGISITNLIFGPIIAGYYTLTFAWFFCTWWCWWLAAIHLIWINFFHDLFNWCLLINVQINFSQISITDEILLGLTIGSLLLFSQNFAKSQH